jgi:hypothetical protein
MSASDSSLAFAGTMTRLRPSLSAFDPDRFPDGAAADAIGISNHPISDRQEPDTFLGPNPAAIHLQRPVIPLGPTAANFRKDRRAILGHGIDSRARRFGWLVPCAPDQQFEQNRSKVDSLFREPINDAPSVCRIRLRSDNFSLLQLSQAICQDVRRDSLSGLLKLPVRSKSAHHHVANNQQRPAVSKYFERYADRATRTMSGFRPAGHRRTLSNVTC